MIKAYIPILLGSSRTLRQSVKVAQFILEQLRQCDSGAGRSSVLRIQTELIDLREYRLPILDERLNEMSTPLPTVKELVK